MSAFTFENLAKLDDGLAESTTVGETNKKMEDKLVLSCAKLMLRLTS